MYHYCINLLASTVQWSPSIIVGNLHAAFVTLYKAGNKVQVSTPASKDMNTVVDVYIINNITRTMIQCTRRQQTMASNIVP